MNNDEKLGGPARQESSFFPFRSIDRDFRLREIPSSSNSLSWAGSREIITNGIKETVWIQCRLDRAFGNAEWFHLFPRAHATYLEKLGSDHRPVLTSLATSVQTRRGRFCFDKRWCVKPEVLEIVRRGWNLPNMGGAKLVSDRIRSCRKELAKWKREADCNSKRRIQKLRRELDQEDAKQHPDMNRLRSLKVEIEKAYKEEETFWI